MALCGGGRHRPHGHVVPPAAAAAARPIGRRQLGRPLLHELRLPCGSDGQRGRGTPLELHGGVDHGVPEQAGCLLNDHSSIFGLCADRHNKVV